MCSVVMYNYVFLFLQGVEIEEKSRNIGIRTKTERRNTWSLGEAYCSLGAAADSHRKRLWAGTTVVGTNAGIVQCSLDNKHHAAK